MIKYQVSFLVKKIIDHLLTFSQMEAQKLRVHSPACHHCGPVDISKINEHQFANSYSEIIRNQKPETISIIIEVISQCFHQRA